MRTTRSRLSALRTVGGGLLAASLLLACGDTDTSESDLAGPDQPSEIAVVGGDYFYEGLPETMKAGTALTFRNDSATEAHEVVAVRLDDDESRGVAEILQLPPEELRAALGPASAVLVAGPKAAGIPVVGSGALDEPGRYAIFCLIPTGADPEEYLAAAAESDGPPQVDGGPPHFVTGMWAELEVTG